MYYDRLPSAIRRYSRLKICATPSGRIRTLPSSPALDFAPARCYFSADDPAVGARQFSRRVSSVGRIEPAGIDSLAAQRGSALDGGAAPLSGARLGIHEPVVYRHQRRDFAVPAQE